jgi:hypothetical protein
MHASGMLVWPLSRRAERPREAVAAKLQAAVGRLYYFSGGCSNCSGQKTCFGFYLKVSEGSLFTSITDI